MRIDVTPEAIEVLQRSLELGGVDPAGGGGVRLRLARSLGGGSSVQVELAEGPNEAEETVELEGLRLFVDPEVASAYPDAIVTVDPNHDRIALHPRE